MITYPLNKLLAPDIIVEEYNDEYKSFTYVPDPNEELTSYRLAWRLEDIKKMCGATYWKCVHAYIKGWDSITGEEYCINNDTLDIPFKRITIIDIYNAFNIIFKTVLEESTDETPYNMYEYWNSILIHYFKIVMKRFKPDSKKKYRRKGIPGKVKLAVMERDNYKCQMCGATVDDGIKLHIDHIIPISKGGTNDIDNLQVLCHKCNLAKTNRTDLKCTREKIGELKW